MQKRLEYVGGGSAKFWQVTQDGAELAVTFGRLGTAGQTQLRSFDSPAAARAEAEKQANAKLAKGYRAVAKTKGGAKSKAGAKAKASAKAGATRTSGSHPFLFVGQGFGTSYKCLECYLWFERAPSAVLRAKIKAALPKPLTSFARFKDDILHFGSDDGLELAVKAAYEPVHASKPFEQAIRDVTAIAEAGKFEAKVLFPATKTWKAFCDDFERAMIEIHGVAKLKLALKPDDGENKSGPWHRWSVLESYRLAEQALASRRKPSTALASLTVNLLESLDERMVKRLSPSARKVWLAWMDLLLTSGPKDLRDMYVDFAPVFVDSFEKSARAEVMAGLSKAMRAAVAEPTDE